MAQELRGVRLRQAVLVASDLQPLVARLQEELGLDEPFRDPGVGEFGLANAVFAIGDCFLEIVSPVTGGTAATWLCSTSRASSRRGSGWRSWACGSSGRSI